jgi:hypothetical protein
VVAKVRERLSVSKQTMHRIHMERFNLKKLKEAEGKGQYHVEISNRFAVLENLNTEVDINRAWNIIRAEYNNFSKESLVYYELKKHKPWFYEGCSKLLDRTNKPDCKLNNSIWNKEELPDQRKVSIIIPVHKKGDKTDCSNYGGISLLSNLHENLSNCLLSK